MLNQLLSCFLAYTFLFTIYGQQSNKAFHYDAYGHVHGGYNVSPKGVFGHGSRISSNWLHSITGPSGNAAELLKKFSDPYFMEAATYGSLRDHIAILSKILSVILVHDGQENEIRELNRKLTNLLNDPKRPELFSKAFSKSRIDKIREFFAKLDLNYRTRAGQELRMLGVGSLKSFEGPLIERILLLIACYLYANNKPKANFVENILYFHYQNFVASTKARVVGVQLTPDVPFLLAHILLQSCAFYDKGTRDDRSYWSTYLENWLVKGVNRGDLTESIAFEIDGIAGKEGRQCLDNTMKLYTIDYNRNEAFPTYPVLGKGPHLRHSPIVVKDWDAGANAYGAHFQPGQALINVDPRLRRTSLKIELNQKGNILNVQPEDSRFLIVKIRKSGARRPSRSVDATDDFEEDNSWENEFDAGESGSTADDFDSNTGLSNIQSFIFTTTADKNNWPKLDIRSVVCIKGLNSCKVLVEKGDILLIYRTSLSDSSSGGLMLPSYVADAIYYAFHGTKREIIFQLAATIPTIEFYHVVLVEG